jgi:hypothetical protein
VLVGTGDHVDAAPDQRLQRLGAAGEVEDLDVEPLGLEVALLLGDGKRQIVEERLATDADGELGLFGRLRERGRGDGECDDQQRDETAHKTVPPEDVMGATDPSLSRFARPCVKSGEFLAQTRGTSAPFR